jgi:hypothetical protein
MPETSPPQLLISCVTALAIDNGPWLDHAYEKSKGPHDMISFLPRPTRIFGVRSIGLSVMARISRMLPLYVAPVSSLHAINPSYQSDFVME